VRIAAALGLCLVAAPALAFTPERAALMVDAVRANGCMMTGDQAEGMLAPLGLGGDEVQAFVDTLFGGALITLSEDFDTLTLSEALCAVEGDESLALITAAFVAQEAEESREVVTVLIDSGLGAVSEDGLTFSLTADFCAADAAGDAPALAQILTDWDANHPAPEVHIQSGGDQ